MAVRAFQSRDFSSAEFLSCVAIVLHNIQKKLSLGMARQPAASSSKPLLGECVPNLKPFPNLDELFHQFYKDEFRSLPSRKKFKQVNTVLLRRIQEEPTPCFLLRAVLEFVGRVNAEKLLVEPYSLTLFEFWLNHFSRLTSEEILLVRGKIIGRHIPRDEYQVFFPVGMGKVFQGSHFVAAHLSPDIDTTVSSFWGWADAFACRVAEGTHQWSLPTGLSDGHIRLYFQQLFGQQMFEQVSRSLPTITISAQDLLTKREFHKVDESEPADSIDHSRMERAVIIVDREGLYKGEWRSGDAEDVRQVVSGLSNSLRWFEGQCHAGMIRVLANKQSTSEEVIASYERVLATVIKQCPAVRESTTRGQTLLHEYLKKVIGLSKGFHHTFRELLLRLDVVFSCSFERFLTRTEALRAKELFDDHGLLKADRVKSARAVAGVVEAMEEALERARKEMEKLSHLLVVKREVLGFPPTFVSLKSDVDEMRSKIDHFNHLTVVIPETNNRWYPLGVVYADDLRKNVLGTASFRDFSTVEETKMASYVEVISIVDHHKARLQTSTPPTLLIGDAQSSNTLVAEQSLRLNIRYGRQAPLQSILSMIEKRALPIEGIVEHLQSALEKKAKEEASGFFVDPSRELSEYFSYIFGILDDTDLLSKVSRRDVYCIKHLLDRMRSLIDGVPSIAVSFDHIPDDEHFVRTASKALLQSKDLYSIYASVYQFREREVEEALTAAIKGEPSTFFLDTKEQNGCCRVGQAKLFHNNIETYQSHRQSLIAVWQKRSEEVFAARPHIDFFLQMISTIPSEKEVHRGEEGKWDHQDEMWLWTPEGGGPEQHLIGFLNSFEGSPTAQKLTFDVEIVGPLAEEKKAIFVQNFPKAHRITVHHRPKGPTVIFLRYKAGAINSRKSQVSPFLPKLLP